MQNQSKNLKDLIPDIKKMLLGVITGTKAVSITDEQVDALGRRLAEKLKRQLRLKTDGNRPEKTLYMSEIGNPCIRQVWYNHQDKSKLHMVENISPSNLIKFLYGDVVEELILELARLAGHEVKNEQEKVEIPLTNGWKLIGKLDAIIDNTVVDVKSTSGYGLKKFEDGLKSKDDAFGYLNQLKGYVGASKLVPHIIPKIVDSSAFLAVDKSTGKLVLDTHDFKNPLNETIAKALEVSKAIESKDAPERPFKLEEHSAGLKLGTNCSYCPFKYECWKDANSGEGLRTFIYSNGPLYLARVDNEPRVTEITQMIKEAHTNA